MSPETTVRHHHELRGVDEAGMSCAFVWGAGKSHRVEHESLRGRRI